MSASATAVLFYGGIPIFADLDRDRYTLDPLSVESCITPRTKAIMVVHLFGYPADMDAIMAIAKKYRLMVIEDAAQAPGVLYKGRPVGAIGDVGGFSLNFHKHIHTGEGGLLVTNNDEIALRCRLIRNHGENATEAYGVEDISNTIGSNYRFTELQAAIGIALRPTLTGYRPCNFSSPMNLQYIL
jgi:dTDP-4-amino-4,6-dideoxygalactose transaminase